MYLTTDEIHDKYLLTLADGKEYLFYPDHHFEPVSRRNVYKKFFVKTVDRCINEDWKSAIAHKQPAIPEGVELEVKSILINFYGKFIETDYDGYHYYLNPHKVAYIKAETIYY